MALRVYAVLTEMEAASNRLTDCVSEFREATENTRNAADTVAAGWEGDAQQAFVKEQQEAIQCYSEMSRLMEGYISDLRTASGSYREADADGVKTLKGV